VYHMSRGSSGHFAKGGAGYFAHNDRSSKTKNSIFHNEKNEVSCSATEAFKTYRSELAKRAEAYTARTNQKLQKNIVTHRSIIVNLEKHHSLKDLEKVKNYLEKTLDTKVLQIAIHRDEGYIDKDTKEEHKNYHAHIEIMGIDSHGISIAQHQNKFRIKKTDTDEQKKAKIEKQKVEQTRANRLDSTYYTKFQTYLANTLNMLRGRGGSKAKRLDTYEYKREAEIRSDMVREQTQELKATIKQVKAQKENLLQTVVAKLKDVNAQHKEEKQELKDSHTATKEDYAELNKKYKALEEKARKKDLTIQQLEQALTKKQAKLKKKEKDLEAQARKKD